MLRKVDLWLSHKALPKISSSLLTWHPCPSRSQFQGLSCQEHEHCSEEAHFLSLSYPTLTTWCPET